MHPVHLVVEPEHGGEATTIEFGPDVERESVAADDEDGIGSGGVERGEDLPRGPLLESALAGAGTETTGEFEHHLVADLRPGRGEGVVVHDLDLMADLDECAPHRLRVAVERR